MVHKISVIPIKTDDMLERLQAKGCEIINVYPITDRQGTDIHIIYRMPKTESNEHTNKV